MRLSVLLLSTASIIFFWLFSWRRGCLWLPDGSLYVRVVFLLVVFFAAFGLPSYCLICFPRPFCSGGVCFFFISLIPMVPPDGYIHPLVFLVL